MPFMVGGVLKFICKCGSGIRNLHFLSFWEGIQSKVNDQRLHAWTLAPFNVCTYLVVQLALPWGSTTTTSYYSPTMAAKCFLVCCKIEPGTPHAMAAITSRPTRLSPSQLSQRALDKYPKSKWLIRWGGNDLNTSHLREGRDKYITNVINKTW